MVVFVHIGPQKIDFEAEILFLIKDSLEHNHGLIMHVDSTLLCDQR